MRAQLTQYIPREVKPIPGTELQLLQVKLPLMLRVLSRRTIQRMRLPRTEMRPTAGLIVIGDEILKGSTMDTNSHFISRKLHELGVQVKKISAIGDNVDEISDEIRVFSERFDYVFTTGGVGPTHDDKTYIGLARAFNDSLYKSPEIVAAIEKYFPPGGLSSDRDLFVDKLSTIPASAQLLWGVRSSNGKPSSFPVVRLNNVISLPGVPRFCERAFMELKDQLFPSSEVKPLFSKTLYTTEDELKFAEKLTRIASNYEDVVEIGSYPIMKNSFFKTKLIVESESNESGQAVVQDILKLLEGTIVHYDSEPWVDTVTKFYSFRERELAKNPAFVAKLDEALDIVRKIVEEYPLEQIMLSFNGGKDCTVLLHMLRLVIDEKYGADIPMQGFHILCEDQFPEATQFIIDVAKRYNIVVTEYPGPLKTGLALLKDEQPNIVAVLMGSRASDPRGKYMKSAVQWTDEDWPRVLRVCPILSWSYKDVWAALRGLCIPYCSLYDMGYTSLGGRSTTVRNPLLKCVGKDGTVRYMPAFTLEDGDMERNGRSCI
ncbi:hypothetical protein Y032_0287g1452 [Ancylostoma ceylanicum]|uniref:FAD synthase n=1 Tax=Ancylostoma ceylanicum TaxID=53326 RepID=A0A016S5Q6_9BILA|nr:hypothetical protein Y032_0287g1452 [Ancylostoma ceylanicum]